MAFVPTIMRAYSITWNIWAMPSCSSPSRYPTAGTPCWPNVSSQVAEPFSPILCSRLVTNTPLRSPGSPVAGSKWNLGTRNRERPLVPGFAPSGRASTRCMMFSVTSWSAEVMNRFTPSRCHDPSSCADGLRAARADVGPRVGLGEHHRGAPAPLDHELGPALLLGGAVAVHDGGEAGAGHVHERRRVGAEDQLGRRPLHARGHAVAAELGRQAQPPPLAVPQHAVGVLERLRAA